MVVRISQYCELPPSPPRRGLLALRVRHTPGALWGGEFMSEARLRMIFAVHQTLLDVTECLVIAGNRCWTNHSQRTASETRRLRGRVRYIAA